MRIQLSVTEPERSNIDVVLYALFKLGGDESKIHTEEIAYEAYCLAKERFAWRLSRFRDMGFPDKEPVRRALMDAAKEKYGHLVEGRAGVDAKGKETDGWALTPEGVTWIRENEERIKSTLGTIRSSVLKSTRHFLVERRPENEITITSETIVRPPGQTHP